MKILSITDQPGWAYDRASKDLEKFNEFPTAVSRELSLSLLVTWRPKNNLGSNHEKEKRCNIQTLNTRFKLFFHFF